MWLYVPNCDPSLASSPSAQGGAVSTSASSWQCRALASSAWWRGKPFPSRTWSLRCERASWLRLLCGAMCEPSTAAHGVAAWTASLAASRASRTVSRESGSVPMMIVISGAQPGGSLRSRALGSSSSRTSPACSRRGLTKTLARREFGETYSDWVSRLRADCSRRERLAARKNAAECSSSVSATAFPTPSARDFKGANSAEHLTRSTGSLHLDQLPNFVRHVFRPALDQSRAGSKPSPASPILNPRFVEWLMGWPPLWTLSACSETALSHFKRDMRSALSQLDLHDAPPAQASLFV